MKRYFTYILSFVMISCIAACTKSEDVVNPNAEGHMALRLVSSTMTRATTPGNGVGVGENDDNLYEDAIISADLYFFDGEGTGNAVWHHRETFTDKREEATITELTIPSNIMSAIFNTNTSQATLYVVANAPAGTLPTYEGLAEGETLPTMADLKAYTISTTSWKTSATPSSAQSSFVMDGEDKITKTNNEIGGTVSLTRAAAKIELSITDVVSSVTVGGETWTPVLGDNDNGSTILVSLNYAVGGSYINGVYDKTFANDNTQQNYGFARDAAVTDKKAYNQAHPFYSYASDWGTGGANEPYLLLVVPWISSKPGTSQQNTYYQIPVGSLDAKQIKRNHYYKVKINVGTMGSFEPQTATEITPSYTVIDWSTGSISTDIKEAHYLVVDENEVIMNNITSYGVGYQSSDEVTAYITGFKCSFYENVNGTATKREYNDTYNVSEKLTSLNDVAPDLENSTFTVKVENGKIVLEHDLDNIMPDKVYHYFPYEITVQVTNPALPGNPEIIVFKQYPALYVEYEYMSECTAFVNGTTRRSQGWWWVAGTASNSKNIYKVTVSAFDSSTADYIIADPREPANNDNFVFRENINANSNVRATATDASGDNTLTGYRGTITGPASENLVAPAFLVSSSYITNGGSGVNTYNYNTNGRYRCAGYQENGYPAGRWRLPTPAEIQVIARMCTEKKLENVFYASGSVYLSSNGAYQVLETNGGTVSYSGETSSTLRCVYDIWYWKDKAKDNSQFIWGADGDVAEKKAAGTYDTYFTPVQQ